MAVLGVPKRQHKLSKEHRSRPKKIRKGVSFSDREVTGVMKNAKQTFFLIVMKN